MLNVWRQYIYVVHANIFPMGNNNTSDTGIYISEMEHKDIVFLKELWHNPHVMKYADEFPYFRDWSKSDSVNGSWQKYTEKRAELKNSYMQLIIYSGSTPIGESFYSVLPEKKKLGRWMIPEKCFIADIKLLPQYWGHGLGTEAMRQVVQSVFGNSDCEIFVVPPHKDNPAAYRVYEKAGFSLIIGKKGGKYLWGRHMLMKLTRKEFEVLYK